MVIGSVGARTLDEPASGIGAQPLPNCTHSTGLTDISRTVMVDPSATLHLGVTSPPILPRD